jgi:hypothetical protein
VTVPHGSGRLAVFDPRGRHPVLQPPVDSGLPTPPFHRIMSLQPEEGLLVLFPGGYSRGISSRHPIKVLMRVLMMVPFYLGREGVSTTQPPTLVKASSRWSSRACAAALRHSSP